MVNQVCPNCGNLCGPGGQVCSKCGRVVGESSNILPSGTILKSRYEIQQIIHTGGMSNIYLARDKGLFERSCVVKEVKERIESLGHLEKLEEEALRMARLSHPGIAIIFDHFVEQEHYFLVVEYIRGKSLSEVYKERGTQLSQDEVVKWGLAICDVLAYIHGEGIIHRDISPDNVMLTEEGNIKFIDFGTLRELRYVAAGKTAGMGKYGYTPPEQWQGKPVPQSDIFALGATLYQLQTGFLPLSKSCLTGKGPQREDFSPKFPPVRSRNPLVSNRLEAVLEKALQLDATRRYDSVTEMRQELSKLTHGVTTDTRKSVVIPDQAGGTNRLTPGSSRELKGGSKPGDGAQERRIKVAKRAKRNVSQEISDAAIRRKTISDTLQHPVTLIPVAVCILSAGYLVMLSPIFGGGLGTFVLIPVSGIMAVASFSINYPRKYLENTRELIEKLDAERRQQEEAELHELRETLQAGFLGVKSVEGIRALDELFSEYEQLHTALEQQRATDPLAVSVIPALAGETFRRGLGVLSDTLDLMNVIHTPGREKLEREIMDVEQEVAGIEDDQSQEARLKLKKEIFDSLKQRLDSLTKLQLWVEQLLYQAQRCEASLHATRIELATIRAGSTKSSVDSVVEALQERINQVKAVQDELSKMGY